MANVAHAAILQRVLSASVTVDNQLVSSIGQGILVLAAVAPGDTVKEAEALASKVIKLKLWDDESGGRVRHLLTKYAWTEGTISNGQQTTVEEECLRHRRRGIVWWVISCRVG